MIDIDQHNIRIQEIIDAEKLTIGQDGTPIQSMGHEKLQELVRQLAGRATTNERRMNELAAENMRLKEGA